MPELLNSLFTSSTWLWVVLGVLLIGSLVFALHHHSFVLTDLVYTFPLIGKLRHYSRDYSKHSRTNWLNVEMRLCRDYRPHVTAISREQFANNTSYLRKAYDDARHPMPGWAMAGLAILIALEGLGFAYLLGSILAVEGSENVRTLLMIAVTVVLSLILFIVNHTAGHELFRWKLLRSCFQSFQMEGNARYSSRSVTLDENQAIDDAEPPHVQCANRVITRINDQGSVVWMIIAIVLTIVIAFGSTMLREATMHVAQLETAPQFMQLFSDGNDRASPQNVSGDQLRAARESAAWVGFIILGVLFMVTQFVGIEAGRRWGFAGRQSKKAFAATRGRADYDTYYEPIQRRINIVSARLETLQQMLERHAPAPLEFHKTFLDFMREERERGATDLQVPEGADRVAERAALLALPAPVEIAAAPAPAPAQPAPRESRGIAGWIGRMRDWRRGKR